ncbi:metallophosphoesterase [bacterium]|nr:metallophosphoesterase [bacterium]MCI0605475.1 metallophosphoesterase [bacterium]
MKGLFLFLLLFFNLALSAGEPRIVAVGDVHGDLSSFVAILKTAQILDANGKWSGGKSILVQTGDVLDRGTQGRQSLDLLMQLEQAAPKQGGRVFPLLGNHEVMNLMGDLRYVPAEEFANFATKQSDQLLKRSYESYKQFQMQKAGERKLPAPEFTPQMEEEWLKAHPRGFLEHREAYGPRGKYGKWLRKQNTVADVQHNVFLHGGIDPKIIPIKVQEVNDRIHRELELFDRYKKIMEEQKVILPFFTFNEMIEAAKQELEIRKKDETLEAFLGLSGWLSVHPEGPLWFRGYAQWPEEELNAAVPALLETFKASHFIVGHTVMQKGEIRTRHNHQVIMIDTGMNQAFYPEGRASALEIQGEKLTAIYIENKVTLN